jgi:hypothetical protein
MTLLSIGAESNAVQIAAKEYMRWIGIVERLVL